MDLDCLPAAVVTGVAMAAVAWTTTIEQAVTWVVTGAVLVVAVAAASGRLAVAVAVADHRVADRRPTV